MSWCLTNFCSVYLLLHKYKMRSITHLYYQRNKTLSQPISWNRVLNIYFFNHNSKSERVLLTVKVATEGMGNLPWSYTDQKENVYAFIYWFRYSLLITTSPTEPFPGCENGKDKPSLLWWICGKCNVTRLVYFTISALPYPTVKYILQINWSLKSCDRPECLVNDDVFLQYIF